MAELESAVFRAFLLAVRSSKHRLPSPMLDDSEKRRMKMILRALLAGTAEEVMSVERASEWQGDYIKESSW